MKLMLHTCCAPCSIQCLETLAAEDIQPAMFWYNPNIHPFTEYHSRLDSLRVFAEEKTLPLIVEDEHHAKFLTPRHKGAKEEKQIRCNFCYRIRMEKTVQMVIEKGYDAFSTTLLISPYQNHELIRQIGEELAARHGIEFLYRDFRSRFRESQKQAREAGFYMQKYCGCIYSEEERYRNSHGGCL